METLLAGAATAPAGRRARSAVTSAVKAAAETVRRTGRSAKARVLRFHEAAPSMQDTLKVRCSFFVCVDPSDACHSSSMGLGLCIRDPAQQTVWPTTCKCMVYVA